MGAQLMSVALGILSILLCALLFWRRRRQAAKQAASKKALHSQQRVGQGAGEARPNFAVDNPLFPQRAAPQPPLEPPPRMLLPQAAQGHPQSLLQGLAYSGALAAPPLEAPRRMQPLQLHSRQWEEAGEPEARSFAHTNPLLTQASARARFSPVAGSPGRRAQREDAPHADAWD